MVGSADASHCIIPALKGQLRNTCAGFSGVEVFVHAWDSDTITKADPSVNDFDPACGVLTDEAVAWTLDADAVTQGITAAAYLHDRSGAYTDAGARVVSTSPGNFDLSGLADGDYTITWAASDTYVLFFSSRDSFRSSAKRVCSL